MTKTNYSSKTFKQTQWIKKTTKFFRNFAFPVLISQRLCPCSKTILNPPFIHLVKRKKKKEKKIPSGPRNGINKLLNKQKPKLNNSRIETIGKFQIPVDGQEEKREGGKAETEFDKSNFFLAIVKGWTLWFGKSLPRAEFPWDIKYNSGVVAVAKGGKCCRLWKEKMYR